MTNAKILTSIEIIFSYLDMVNIPFDCTSKRKNLLPGKYSDEYFQICHSNDYSQKFLVAAKNSDYDIILEDGSFFQFTSTSCTDIHYSFLHKIEKILSYEEFMEKYLTEDNIDSIAQEYEMYLSTDKKSTYPCPIRYDVSEQEYVECLHAYAHLHIGAGTEIRIPFDKIITPLEFVDFVVKHIYKEKWDYAFNHNEEFKKLINNLKNQSEKLESLNFTMGEKLQVLSQTIFNYYYSNNKKKKVKLKSIAKMYQPETITGSDFIENGKYPVYGSGGIIGRYDKYNHTDSELMLSCRGLCGNISFSLPYSWIIGNQMIIKPNESKLKFYLYNYLQIINLKKVETGSVQKQITRTNLENLDIELLDDNVSSLIAKKLELIHQEIITIIKFNDKITILKNKLLPLLINQQLV